MAKMNWSRFDTARRVANSAPLSPRAPEKKPIDWSKVRRVKFSRRLTREEELEAIARATVQKIPPREPR